MYNPQIHKRQSIRIRGYDYSQSGKYFITLNIKSKYKSRFKILNPDNANLLGEIINGKMILSSTGKVAEKCWLAIPEHYPDAILHEFVIMPDHLHGIIELKSKNNNVEIQNFESLHKINKYQKIIPRSIGCIVRGFKTGVTKQLKESIWQRNYYERIIRSEASCKRIARYIINNPVNYDDNNKMQHLQPRMQGLQGFKILNPCNNKTSYNNI